MDPPDVQYANVSERPSGGQWNLRDKRFVEGATLRNWGVVINANVGERDVQGFVRNMVDMGNKSGLTIEDGNPYIIYQNHYRGAQVEELMKIQCIVSKNVRSAKPQYCINVCLKFNMKLGGNNWVLCKPLPLVGKAPTIIIGADVEHPRSGTG
ncbi:hypothetical protein JM18_007737 [Phytophthora kernoviae]|uniref:Piwi domain-containing protein n=2 Tax=Phytophthora kernoviae TaxID=325452 RepID=A0A8T0LPC1_9STRA|nr:hypothetical protein JM16_007798 [Phytophthora kernoviae]KAG2518296.1 hypothetical protein JM18_007737 [Phytophthora kernoviae]